MKKAAKKPNAGSKEHWFSSDRPIETARADVLARSAFAARLAQSISGWDGRDSLVISLHGGWGTGKTSVKNMVLEKLRSSPTRSPQIVEFSPWQVSGTGNLVGTFFNELAVTLRRWFRVGPEEVVDVLGAAELRPAESGLSASFCRAKAVVKLG